MPWIIGAQTARLDAHAGGLDPHPLAPRPPWGRAGPERPEADEKGPPVEELTAGAASAPSCARRARR
eukprot:8433362-Alexandrium_andersonii.AAC.1